MPSMPDSPSSSDPQQKLRDFKPSKEFFVGIDSDGCVFNSMEVKHNDSFSVNFIKYFGLQALSRQVHQAWDFVNLYSQTRGVNRFKAIPLVLDQMRDMPRVQKSGRAPRADLPAPVDQERDPAGQPQAEGEDCRGQRAGEGGAGAGAGVEQGGQQDRP